LPINPDRRFIVIGGRGITIYKMSDATSPGRDYWLTYAFIPPDYYTWRFTDASTLELTYTKTGKQRLYNLDAKAFQ
jgi:hypothetical protein